MSSPPPTKEGRQHIKWDEETIALHDLDRGTRMKIEEPNTPYHYYEELEVEGDAIASSGGIEITDVAMQIHNANPNNAIQPSLDGIVSENVPASPARSASNGQTLKWDELESKLNKHKKNVHSEWDSDSDASSSSASSRRKVPKTATEKAFSQKRKQHYNEFELMKQWRLQHANDDEDEEEQSTIQSK